MSEGRDEEEKLMIWSICNVQRLLRHIVHYLSSITLSSPSPFERNNDLGQTFGTNNLMLDFMMEDFLVAEHIRNGNVIWDLICE